MNTDAMPGQGPVQPATCLSRTWLCIDMAQQGALEQGDSALPHLWCLEAWRVFMQSSERMTTLGQGILTLNVFQGVWEQLPVVLPVVWQIDQKSKASWAQMSFILRVHDLGTLSLCVLEEKLSQRSL